VVYDAHELESEKNGLRGVEKKLVKIIERLLIGMVDIVLVVNDSIYDHYLNMYPELKNIRVIKNVMPIDKSVQISSDALRVSLNIDKEKTIFLYQGGIEKGRGIELLIEAFIKSEITNSSLVFMGYGSLKNIILAAAKGNENIYYHESVALDMLMEYTSSADVGLSIIENTCLSYYYCLPNKIFEYISAGLPIIASNFPEIRKVVDQYEAGVLVNPEVSEELEKAFQLFEFGHKFPIGGRNAVLEKYNWEIEEKEYLEMFSLLK
jgi:glycosyltransferase involved in cell wall biosynthesis